jgi:hypothetical protein
MAIGGTSRTEVPDVVVILAAPYSGACGIETGGELAADSSQQELLTGPC